MEQDGLVPLYEQVRRKILSEIKTGHLAERSFLPPEPELCATYGVSRITLRRAVSELCAEGWLIRQQGRGTLVAPRKMRQTISLSGFSEVVESQGRRAGHRILERKDGVDASAIAARLEAARLVRFTRLLEVDGHPMTLEELYFDADRFAKALAPVEAGESFFATLRDVYHVTSAGAERLIDVGFARPSEAAGLGVSTTEPVYRIEKIVLDENSRPLALSHLVTPCHLVTLTVKN